LHNGRMAMGDPANGLYKAFLFVGIAYFLTAVLAPLLLLMSKGAAFTGYTARGAWWSLLAGIVGAMGAFGVLLAFGVGGRPAAVMSIIFAGAPIVNAVVSLVQHPPAGGWGAVRWQFYAGIALAALGGCLVTYYKPGPPPKGAVHASSPAQVTAPR